MQIYDKIGTHITNLIKGKTVKNEPVIRIDYDNDSFVSGNDPGLVMKKEHDGEWKWEPVSDFKQLQYFLKIATTEEKRDNLGLWKDKGSFLRKPDGIPQDKEVTTMGEKWDSMNLCEETSEYSEEYGRDVSWSKFYTQVFDDEVKVKIKNNITGTIARLEEPEYVMKEDKKEVTAFRAYTEGVYINHKKYEAVSFDRNTDTVTKDDLREYLEEPQVEGAPSVREVHEKYLELVREGKVPPPMY
ncbi:MAG: hypothetical protein ABRQ37_20445 [Candidatus Eremiobacterota bacterium]